TQSIEQSKPPTYLDVPAEIGWGAVDKPDPQNPVGVKGVGEPVQGSGAAAITSAIADALGGHLFNRTPVSLDMILNHLNNRPKAVIDSPGIAERKGIRETADGVEIGALETLTAIERNPIIKAKYRVLADAATKVAAPQIRNHGTLGGNASQDARCLYYRYGLPCYRAGGNACYADTPEGVNREHALFDTDRCVAVSQSDTAPALVALDAKFVIRSSKGERVVPTEEFFIGPQIDITRMTST